MLVRVLKPIPGLGKMWELGEWMDIDPELGREYVRLGLVTEIREPEAAVIQAPEKAIMPKPKGR